MYFLLSKLIHVQSLVTQTNLKLTTWFFKAARHKISPYNIFCIGRWVEDIFAFASQYDLRTYGSSFSKDVATATFCFRLIQPVALLLYYYYYDCWSPQITTLHMRRRTTFIIALSIRKHLRTKYSNKFGK